MTIQYHIDSDYIIRIRRQIHKYPELSFDLPKTAALVAGELKVMGIDYTEEYGRCSVVGVINPESDGPTIAIRADMDALPVEETNDLEFKSRYPGKMHACGHDAHTAMLLGTAKALNEIRDRLDCRVKLIFQPSEEGPESGAKWLVEQGVMDDVDVITGLHVENWLGSGTIGICPGMSMAASRRFKIEFFGKASHGTMPQNGVNALAMAMKTYHSLMQMQAVELNPLSQWVCSVGTLYSGTAANVLPDHAVMEGTIRTYDEAVEDHIVKRLEAIAENAASEVGGACRVETPKYAPYLYNDPQLAERLRLSAVKAVGEERVVNMPVKMSSEDFSYYLHKKPGVFFRLGTRNEAKGCTGVAHNNNFMIDEEALQNGSAVCVQFVLDQMNNL